MKRSGPLRTKKRTARPSSRTMVAPRWAEAIFEGSRDAIFISDADSRFIAVNGAACELTGYSREELLEMRIPDLHEEIDLEAYREYHDLIMAGQEALSEAMVLRKDGTKVATEFNNRRIDIGGVPHVYTTVRDIGQGRVAEAAPGQREDLCEQVFDVSNDAILIVGMGGQILEANLTASRRLGYSVAELKRMTVNEIDTPDAAERVAERIATIKGEGRAIFETTQQRRDGTPVPTEVSTSLIDYHGEPALLSVCRDLSERKRAEALLHEAAEKYRSLVENATDGICVAQDGLFKFVNPAAAKFFGYSEAELMQRPFLEIIHPDDRERVARIAQRRVQGLGVPPSYEFRAIAKDGESRWVRNRAVVIDWEGKPAALAFLTDITEQWRTQEELRQSQARLDLALRSAQMGVWHWDVLENRRSFDDQVCHLLGIDPATFTGSEEEFLRAVHPDDRETIKAALRRTLDHGAVYEPEYRVVWPDGSIHEVAARGRLAYDGAGRPTRLNGILWDVTDRKQAERELQESEQKFAAAFHASPNLMAVTKVADGTIVEVNEAYSRLLGHSREESLGKTTSELSIWVDPSDRVTFVEALEKFGQIDSFQTRLRRKDGGVLECVDSARTIDFGGERCVLSVVHDVTARKQAEDALRTSEEHYRTIFEHSLAGVYRSTTDGRVLHANEAFARMLGFTTVEEMLATPAVELYPGPSDRQGFLAALRTDGVVKNQEFQLLRRDGKPIWVVENTVLVADEEGRLTVIEGTIVDVTERKRAEETLRASEARFRSYFELPLHGIAMSSTEKRWLQVNDRLCSILGYSRDELLQMTWPQITHPEDVEANVRLFDRLLAGEIDRYALEKRFIRKDGTLIWTNLSAGCVRKPDGQVDYLVVLVEDISEKKAAEDELEHSHAQLLQAQKMEAVGLLAGGVAHDFNNILQAMLSHVELFRRDPHSREVELTDLAAQIHRGAALARQLLLFSRPEQARRETLDLNEVIRSSGTLLRRLLRENVVLSVSPADGPLVVDADHTQLDQVLLNLAVNAGDAMPTGGRLTIRTGRTGDMVWFEVEDTGSGIPKGIRHKLFDPFFTTKPLGHGTGLGLSVVHGIVTSHGGRIEMESAENVGTTFRVLLPEAAGGRRPESVSPLGGAIPAGHGERVLLLEDEVAAREALKEILVSLGYEVTGVGTGAEAGRLPTEPPFAVLVTDIMLPDVDGAAIASGLVDRWPDMRVILMSGYSEDEALRHAADLGNVKFLQKPFDMATLANAIREVLDRKIEP
jgi:two-component system cell cycle sensor histidine kinase/response regulator CckA